MKRNVLFQKKTPGAETVQKFPHPFFSVCLPDVMMFLISHPGYDFFLCPDRAYCEAAF